MKIKRVDRLKWLEQCLARCNSIQAFAVITIHRVKHWKTLGRKVGVESWWVSGNWYCLVGGFRRSRNGEKEVFRCLLCSKTSLCLVVFLSRDYVKTWNAFHFFIVSRVNFFKCATGHVKLKRSVDTQMEMLTRQLDVRVWEIIQLKLHIGSCQYRWYFKPRAWKRSFGGCT